MLVSIAGDSVENLKSLRTRIKYYDSELWIYLLMKICDLENLRDAHKHARKDKLYYREVKMIDANP